MLVDIFTKQQMHSESVDEYAKRIKKLVKSIEFDNSTLMYALLNGLKPAIKGPVLAKKKPTVVCGSGRWRTSCRTAGIR